MLCYLVFVRVSRTYFCTSFYGENIHNVEFVLLKLSNRFPGRSLIR